MLQVVGLVALSAAATAARPAREAARAILFWFGDIHSQGTVAQLVIVEHSYGLLGRLWRVHLHKPKPFRPSRVSLCDNRHRFNITRLGKQASQLILCALIRQVPHV